VISVLVANERASIREAFAAALDLQEDLSVVATAASGREAVNLAWLHQPDTALVGVEMPDNAGFVAIKQMRAAVPRCRPIAMARTDQPCYLRQAYEHGALAYLTADMPLADVVHALKSVHTGRHLIDRDQAYAHGQSPLSPRELEVLRAVARLGTTAEIAKTLHLCQGTVNNHISSILAKLGAVNRAQAVVIARENAWL
jgi:two-component system response regulator DesR